MPDKKFYCRCLKPELLEKYGFVKDGRGYHYYVQSGKKRVSIWNATAKNRTLNRLTFDWGTPLFTMELACLFGSLLKDGIIEFDVTTEDERIQRKINFYEYQIQKLKGGK